MMGSFTDVILGEPISQLAEKRSEVSGLTPQLQNKTKQCSQI